MKSKNVRARLEARQKDFDENVKRKDHRGHPISSGGDGFHMHRPGSNKK